MRRWSWVGLAWGVAACSWVESTRLDPGKTDPPGEKAFHRGVAEAFAKVKLPGSVIVSRLRRAPLIAPGYWMTCMKSAAEDPQTYAVFFDGDRLVQFRIAVLIDNCDRETYAPLTESRPG